MRRSTQKNKAEPSQNSLPLVSILMATYNRRHRLIRAIESVRAQTYPNWELCLVCDGGTPVDDIVEKFNDPRIIFKHNPQNKGYGHTANTAFSMSKGQYIACLGDDDVWRPNHIEMLMGALLSQNKAGFVYANSLCTRRKINEDGTSEILAQSIPCHGHAWLGHILEFNNITGIAAIFERKMFELAGGFDEKLRCLVDFDLWRRILCFTKTVYVDEITSEYFDDVGCGKDHLTNLSSTDNLRYKKQQLRILYKKLPNGMEEHYANALQFVRGKHLFLYILGLRDKALKQSDEKKARKLAKFAERKPIAILAGKYVDLATFLMKDGDIETALDFFKKYIEQESNPISIYLTALECAIMCNDPWAHSIFSALRKIRRNLTVDDQERLAKMVDDLKKVRVS